MSQLSSLLFAQTLLFHSQAPGTIFINDLYTRHISHFKDERPGTEQLLTCPRLHRVSEIRIKHSSAGFLSSHAQPEYLLLISVIFVPFPAPSVSEPFKEELMG